MQWTVQPASSSECLVIDCGTISSLPKTITDSDISGRHIESDMVVVNAVIGTLSAQSNNWSVTTGDGTLTISGSISGSTTLTLYLMKSR